MLDLNNLGAPVYKTDVEPSDNLFSELGKNTYDYKDLLSELIDNSIAAKSNDLLRVLIRIKVDSSFKAKSFFFEDNAKGISRENFGRAISPAQVQTSGSLNEHGLGMKQAIAAIGKLNYLATKTIEEDKAKIIRRFGFGPIETFETDFDRPHGTIISIENLNPIVDVSTINYTRTYIPYLGARYRRYLKPDNLLINITIQIERDSDGAIINSWNVEELKPTYFHPSTRTNSPIIIDFPLKGNNWRAKLTFGYAPRDDSEYTELGLSKPSKYNPYNVSINRQGLDIILHDRVILFHQLAEVGIVQTRHSDYNTVRGEIILLEGFSTAITKNSIIHDQNFLDCIEKIRAILSGEAEGPRNQKKDYLKRRTFPEEIPEALLRDRLATWLKSNNIAPRTNVHTEYVIQGIEGYIDIFADNEAWELKVGQASALDVYQLFMYMDVGEINKGFLVAKSFSTGADVAKNHLQTKHNVNLILSPLDSYPINHPPSDQERSDYY